MLSFITVFETKSCETNLVHHLLLTLPLIQREAAEAADAAAKAKGGKDGDAASSSGGWLSLVRKTVVAAAETTADAVRGIVS